MSARRRPGNESPARVIFAPHGGEKLPVDINGGFADVTPDPPADE
jgi:hypothetical protein